MSGLSLPVTGGYVGRSEGNRIIGHLTVAKVAAGLQSFNAMLGISDEYDFYTADEHISTDRENPTTFQNWVTNLVPYGTVVTLPGVGPIPMPVELYSTASTEAIGFVENDHFIGTMQLEYHFEFRNITPQTRTLLSRQLGAIPETAEMTGAGRFSIELQSDI